MNNVIQYQKERLGEKKISEEKSLSIITYHSICIKYTVWLFILPAGEMKSNCLTYIGLKINL